MADVHELPDGWSVIAPVVQDTGGRQFVDLKIMRPDGSKVAARAAVDFNGWKQQVCEFVDILAQIEAIFGRPEKDGLAYTDIEFTRETLGEIEDEEEDWEKEGESWKTG